MRFFSALAVSLLISHARGHAIFLEPPSRPTIGKVKPQCNLEWNYEHSSLYCGGFSVQHNKVNKGRCGICGDAYTGAQPHQAGGKWAKGVIARSYKVGQIIEVEIDLVANHLGFFTFAICPNNDIHKSPSERCFDSHQLRVESPRSLVYSSYFATAGVGIKKMRVELPTNMSCSQCILQYTYTAGNNWGTGPQSAEVVSQDCLQLEGKLGCGSQETFRGCADICVGDFCPQDQETCITADKIRVPSSEGGNLTPKPTTPNPVTSVPVTAPATSDPGVTCQQAGVVQQHYILPLELWCRERCLNKPVSQCYSDPQAEKFCFCVQTPTDPLIIPQPTPQQPSSNTTPLTPTSPLPGSPSQPVNEGTTDTTLDLDQLCGLASAKADYSSSLSDWYCTNICGGHLPASACAQDPVARFSCLCDGAAIGPSIAQPDHLPSSDKICTIAAPRREFYSPMAQWYCSQRCHNQRERDCYTDAVSRVVCQCRGSPGSRGVTQAQAPAQAQEADLGKLELLIPERLTPLYNERNEKLNPLVVNVIERNMIHDANF